MAGQGHVGLLGRKKGGVCNDRVDQAGEAVTVAFATNVPYQNNVSETSTTHGLVLVDFHDRL